MRNILPLLALIALLFTGATHAPKEVTISGTLVDTKCYGMDHANHGQDHGVKMKNGTMGTMPGCATACARMGVPMGVLEGGKTDGRVYLLVAPSMALAPHAAKEARVTGEMVYEGAILPSKIEVKNADGKWEVVQVPSMM